MPIDEHTDKPVNYRAKNDHFFFTCAGPACCKPRRGSTGAAAGASAACVGGAGAASMAASEEEDTVREALFGDQKAVRCTGRYRLPVLHLMNRYRK